MLRRRAPGGPGPARVRDAGRHRPGRRARGFTLLEIMVVVLIIGVMITFAMFSISGRNVADRLDNEAQKLHRMLALAQEEAELQGLFIGFRPTETQWQWVAIGGDGRWVPYAENGVFRPQAIPQPIEIRLRIEGRAMPPAAQLEDPTASMEPLGLFLSSGEVTPMVIDLFAGDLDLAYRVEVDVLGRIKRAQIPRDEVGE